MCNGRFKLVCNVNIVHRPAAMLYCTTVLYPTMQRGEGTEIDTKNVSYIEFGPQSKELVRGPPELVQYFCL
jgi:hypothetical protein